MKCFTTFIGICKSAVITSRKQVSRFTVRRMFKYATCFVLRLSAVHCVWLSDDLLAFGLSVCLSVPACLLRFLFLSVPLQAGMPGHSSIRGYVQAGTACACLRTCDFLQLCFPSQYTYRQIFLIVLKVNQMNCSDIRCHSNFSSFLQAGPRWVMVQWTSASRAPGWLPSTAI